MKLTILTLPFNDNYGGVLQSAALQYYLKTKNFDVQTFKWIPTQGLRHRLGWLFYYFRNRCCPFSALAKLLNGKAHYFRSFMRKHLKETTLQFSTKIKNPLKYGTWVVGSDQVWRCDFIKRNPTFWFLAFLPKEIRNKSISYAASLGNSEWTFDKDLTQQVVCWAKDFKSISVREDKGKELCYEHLGVHSTVVPDPTMLLQACDYDKMIAETINDYPKDYQTIHIAYYILDMTQEKKRYINDLENKIGTKAINLMYNPSLDSKLVLKRPIEQWLDIISKAQLIITDSFHGCVFSCIYNTNFVVFQNSTRGSSRFETLLTRLNLTNRIVDPKCSSNFPEEPINWDEVNEKITQFREIGEKFLEENLTNSKK